MMEIIKKKNKGKSALTVAVLLAATLLLIFLPLSKPEALLTQINLNSVDLESSNYQPEYCDIRHDLSSAPHPFLSMNVGVTVFEIAKAFGIGILGVIGFLGIPVAMYILFHSDRLRRDSVILVVVIVLSVLSLQSAFSWSAAKTSDRIDKLNAYVRDCT